MNYKSNEDEVDTFTRDNLTALTYIAGGILLALFWAFLLRGFDSVVGQILLITGAVLILCTGLVLGIMAIMKLWDN